MGTTNIKTQQGTPATQPHKQTQKTLVQPPQIKHQPQHDTRNMAIKAAITPFAMAAGIAPGTYLLSRLKTGTAMEMDFLMVQNLHINGMKKPILLD